MNRVVAILLLLFAYSWPARIMVGVALFWLVIGIFSGPGSITNSFFLIIVILWSTGAFRQIVSNPRLSMLPRFRAHAVAALVLVALTVGGAAALAAALSPEPFAPRGIADAGLMAFALVSAYILLNQWFATFRAPMLPRLLLLLLYFRYVHDETTLALANSAWALAAVALLGWLWLLVSLQGRAQPSGPNPSLRIESSSGINANQGWTLRSLFGIDALNLGRPAHPAGTLVRGANDGWMNRIGASLFWVPGFALLWMLSIHLAPATPSRGSGVDAIPVFLALSFFVTAIQVPMLVIDWPARLRHVWLRSPGNRAALWRMLDRMVREEAVIVAAITAIAALVISLVTATAAWLLLAYTVGSTAAMLLGAYWTIALRISGASVSDIMLYALLGWVPVFGLIMGAGPVPTVLTSLIIVFGFLAWMCRLHVRRQFMRIDWCALKPTRDLDARRRAAEKAA